MGQGERDVEGKAGGIIMQNVSAVAFSKNIFGMLEHTIKFNEPLSVSTEHGSAVILSGEDYRNMQETLYLLSVPGMRDKLLAGKSERIEDCVPEEEVEW